MRSYKGFNFINDYSKSKQLLTFLIDNKDNDDLLNLALKQNFINHKTMEPYKQSSISFFINTFNIKQKEYTMEEHDGIQYKRFHDDTDEIQSIIEQFIYNKQDFYETTAFTSISSNKLSTTILPRLNIKHPLLIKYKELNYNYKLLKQTSEFKLYKLHYHSTSSKPNIYLHIQSLTKKYL